MSNWMVLSARLSGRRYTLVGRSRWGAARLVWMMGALFLGAGSLSGLAEAQGRFITDEEDSASLQGQSAPDFSVTTLDGKNVKLSALRGRVVLVDFWASWCGPCQRSMPHLEQTYQKFKGKGLEVVGINVDKEEAKARAFLEKVSRTGPLSYKLALDPDARVMGDYQVMSMPTAFIVDRKGIVQHRIVGFSEKIGEETHAKLEALLK